MNAYLIQIRMNLRLTMRDRTVWFFNFVFPLIFFFIFGTLMRSDAGGTSAQIVTMVLTIGILGNGFFGAGIRAVMDREQNILRRFKVAPINAGPILVSSLVTGVVLYLPLAMLVLWLAHQMYGMPVPKQMSSLVLFIVLGVLAFRSLGGIIAAVANSMQESQIIIQLLYFPMLFLGSGMFPITFLPGWVQTIAQFMPTAYLSLGLQSIIRGKEGLVDHLPAVGALAVTAVLGTFLGVKLFRWEKDEKLRPAAKLWLLAVVTPFLILGTWQAYAKTNIEKGKLAERDTRRNHTWLIRDARIFVADGTVIEQGSVLVRDGKIQTIYDGPAPDPKSLRADVIEAAGKTLLPGLIDVHVHLGASGGFSDKPEDYSKMDQAVGRELAAYLYSGVTAVKSVGDGLDMVLKERALFGSGEKLGAELFAVGPMFTAEGGHGAEFLKYVPESVRSQLEQQLVRTPKTADEARAQVADLKMRGVDGIKTILDAGAGKALYNRLDTGVFKAIVAAAQEANLPVVSHTGDSKDVADAVDARVNGIEHGSHRDLIPAALFTRMKAAGVAYDPTLAVVESIQAFIQGAATPLDRSLVQQTVPPELLASTKKLLSSPELQAQRAAYGNYPFNMGFAKQNLAAANAAGVMLVAGTDAGNPLMTHGPGIHREIQLWVEAGLPPGVALQAATYNNARLLRADSRIGLIRQGYEASLLLVDGNPLKDISATERISVVLFKGERVSRAGLFDEE